MQEPWEGADWIERFQRWLASKEMTGKLGEFTREQGRPPDGDFHRRFVAGVAFEADRYRPGPELELHVTRDYVLTWLLETQRARPLLLFTARILGPWGTVEESEDAVHDYLTAELEKLIAKFDPSRGSFLGLFYYSYRRFLYRRLKRIGERHDIERIVRADPHTDPAELSELDRMLREWPEMAAQDSLHEVVEALPRNRIAMLVLTDAFGYDRNRIAAVPELESNRRCTNPAFAVMTLFHLLPYRHAQIAEILRISVSSSEQRCHRACKLLKQILGRDGPPGPGGALVTRSSKEPENDVARKLRRAIDALPVEIGGDHVTDSDEVLRYVLDGPEALAEEIRARLEVHLDSCAECSESVGRLRAIASAWTGESGESRLESFRKRVRTSLESAPSLTARALAALARAVERTQIPSIKERLLAWSAGLPDASHLIGRILLRDPAALAVRAGTPTVVRRGEQQIALQVDSQRGRLQVSVKGVDRDSDVPWILITPLAPGGEPALLTPVRGDDPGTWVAHLDQLPQGEYAVIVEPRT